MQVCILAVEHCKGKNKEGKPFDFSRVHAYDVNITSEDPGFTGHRPISFFCPDNMKGNVHEGDVIDVSFGPDGRLWDWS